MIYDRTIQFFLKLLFLSRFYCISESNSHILHIIFVLFFVYKIMHNLKIGFKFVNHLLYQTCILTVFKDERSKGILFLK